MSEMKWQRGSEVSGRKCRAWWWECDGQTQKAVLRLLPWQCFELILKERVSSSDGAHVLLQRCDEQAVWTGGPGAAGGAPEHAGWADRRCRGQREGQSSWVRVSLRGGHVGAQTSGGSRCRLSAGSMCRRRGPTFCALKRRRTKICERLSSTTLQSRSTCARRYRTASDGVSARLAVTSGFMKGVMGFSI